MAEVHPAGTLKQKMRKNLSTQPAENYTNFYGLSRMGHIDHNIANYDRPMNHLNNVIPVSYLQKMLNKSAFLGFNANR